MTPRKTRPRGNRARKWPCVCATLLVFCLAVSVLPAVSLAVQEREALEQAQTAVSAHDYLMEMESLDEALSGAAGVVADAPREPAPTSLPVDEPSAPFAVRPPSAAAAVEGRHAFNRLLTRILSPISRISCG